MFSNFPKKRHPLPPEIEEIYLAHLKSNREGRTCASSLAARMESWMHRLVAADVSRDDKTPRVTLELGAGTLNQLQYEPANACYDIVEPLTTLYFNSPFLHCVRNIYKDISDVPTTSRYDRITSIATLEHVCNLPEVVAKSGLLLSQDGVFRSSVPSEGTLLWYLGWNLTTGIEFRIKHGMNYGVIMKYEHINSAKEIEEVLRYFYSTITYKICGICKELSFYRYYECSSPILDRCINYVNQ